MVSPLLKVTVRLGTSLIDWSLPRISLYESGPSTEKFPLCPAPGVTT